MGGDKKTLEIEKEIEIELKPNADTFRENLLKERKANYTIFFSDGHKEDGIWNANKIGASSNIKGNIRSGFLRSWKEKGILRAVFEVK